MRLYIAGSSQELDRVRKVLGWIDEFASQLTSFEELEITHNWLKEIENRGDANPIDASVEERAAYARGDLAGVREADVVWLLMPPADQHSVGCYWEAGYADALGKEILISGSEQLRSIFTTRGYNYDTDWEAFERIKDTVYNDGATTQGVQLEFQFPEV